MGLEAEDSVSKGSAFLDDFLFSGEHGSGHCAFLLSSFMDLARKIGVPLAHEKTEGPVQVLTFLGIKLDTVQQTSRLPQDKLDKLLCVTTPPHHPAYKCTQEVID